jgi:hypothetical protein
MKPVFDLYIGDGEGNLCIVNPNKMESFLETLNMDSMIQDAYLDLAITHKAHLKLQELQELKLIRVNNGQPYPSGDIERSLNFFESLLIEKYGKKGELYISEGKKQTDKAVPEAVIFLLQRANQTGG